MSEILKKLAIIFFLFLFSNNSFCQKIFTVENSSKSDLKVFVTKYQSQADLLVYKVDYTFQSAANKGHWFFVEYESQADKKIFFCDYASQADLKIFFVDYKSKAKWKKNKKKHLLY